MEESEKLFSFVERKLKYFFSDQHALVYRCTQLIKMCSTATKKSLILTPIGRTAGPDYDGQLKAFAAGTPMRWDDSYRNLARVGDYFAFTKYGNWVRFHLIVAVLPATDRPGEWKHAKHCDRQVVVLSPTIMQLNWDNWLKMDGHKRPNGTTHLRDGVRTSSQFIKHLNSVKATLAQVSGVDVDHMWDHILMDENSA